MTTSQRTQFLSDALDVQQRASPIPIEQRDYFRDRTVMRAYRLIVSTFHRLGKSRKHYSKAYLAKRLKRRPEQITRWMSAPTNLELNTLSDFLLAMGHELVLDVRDLAEQGPLAPTDEAWLRPSSQPKVAEKNAEDSIAKLEGIDIRKDPQERTNNALAATNPPAHRPPEKDMSEFFFPAQPKPRTALELRA